MSVVREAVAGRGMTGGITCLLSRVCKPATVGPVAGIKGPRVSVHPWPFYAGAPPVPASPVWRCAEEAAPVVRLRARSRIARSYRAGFPTGRRKLNRIGLFLESTRGRTLLKQ